MPAAAADMRYPLPFNIPVIVVDKVITGVEPDETEPLKPFADATLIEFSIPTVHELFVDKLWATPFIVIVVDVLTASVMPYPANVVGVDAICEKV